MKRKALLAIAGCPAKTFETLSARNLNPVTIGEDRWSDYDMKDALTLRIHMQAMAGTDHESAMKIAGGALGGLKGINPFGPTGDYEMWAALVRYHWASAPDDWDGRTVICGRWQDIEAKAKDFVADLGGDARIVSIQAISITQAANHVLTEAWEFGLPEADDPQLMAVDQDLEGFPDWFKAAEARRRALLFSGRK